MAKSAPDYYSSVSIAGKYGDEMKPVLVDVNGQMYIVMTGQEIGVTNLPSDYFKDGESVTVPGGVGVVNLPSDYFKASENVGNVANMPADYYKALQDLGRVKGDESGTPRFIAVDGTGIMLARMKGAFGELLKDIALDTNGIMLSRMKGAFGAVLKDIAVDTNGLMLSIMKGDFGGVLKTVALDTAGNMKANLAVQDLTRLTMRTSLGTPVKADLHHVFAGIGSHPIVDLDGKGVILGGTLIHDVAASHKICTMTMVIDEVNFGAIQFASLRDINAVVGFEYPFRLIHYNDTAPCYYAMSFNPGWTFDTHLTVNISENVGAAQFDGYLYYTLA